MPEKKLDLSSLDPSRETERWERIIDSITERAVARHQRRLTVSFQLLAWARPVLAAAAAISLLLGAKIWLRHGEPSVALTSPYRRAYALTEWAGTGERPPTSNVIYVLGDAQCP